MPRTATKRPVSKVMISLSPEHAVFIEDARRRTGLGRSAIIRQGIDRLVNDPVIFLGRDMTGDHKI